MSLKLDEYVKFANSLANLATNKSMQYFRSKLDIENKDDAKTISEKELELVTEDEATSEDAQKENQE